MARSAGTRAPEREHAYAAGEVAAAAALVVHTRSRRGRRLYAEAQTLLRDRGVMLHGCFPVRDPDHLPQAVREAVAGGARLVIVGGGDGTISAIVDELAYREAVLGILPLGTANSFARTLGIPLDVAGAVEVVGGGDTADVDLGRIDDDYFANTAALGLASAVARSRLGALKRYLGRISYLVAGGREFLAHRPFRCTLTRGGRRTSFEALDVLIANGRYQGGTLVAPQASVESRELWIRIVKGRAKANLLRVWLAAAAGRTAGPALVETVRAAEALIETTPAQDVSIDGEVVARTPIRVAVAPDALKVKVPRHAGRG